MILPRMLRTIPGATAVRVFCSRLAVGRIDRMRLDGVVRRYRRLLRTLEWLLAFHVRFGLSRLRGRSSRMVN
jgi:hypothetical protein